MAVGPGTILGSYEIVEQIGAGGMGAVYRARDSRLQREVAIKVLLSDRAVDAIARERFDREARAIAALTHPRICTLHDVGHDGGIDYLVMEYVDGETLARRLGRGPIPLPLVIEYAQQIAEALDFAHRKGFVHRDLKPGNVMVTRSGVKLLDFGLARRSSLDEPHDDQPTLTATIPGTVVGSLPYMAPEQLGGGDVDRRADIWAFGVVLFELATGKRAFTGDRSTIAAAIVERDPPRLDASRPDLPPLLGRIMARCLMKDREARWQSMQDVSAALGWIAEGIQSTAVARQPTRWRERAAWAIAVLACAALGVVTARWLASHPTDAPLAPDRVQIMTPPTGDPLSIALSPDGRKLVVAGRDDKIDRLFLYSLDTGLLQPIERTEGGTEPFWSSDSQSIGFFADGWLKLMNVSKGAVSSLTRVLSARGATWFDDVIVYSPYSIARLKRISASSGGAPVQLSGESARSPKFLPDGQHVLFYRTGSEDTAGVYVTDLAGREPKKVLDWHADGAAVPLDANHLLFVKQGTLFVQRFDHDHLELEGDPVAIDERVVSDQGLSSVTVSASGAIAFRKGEPVTRQFVWIDRAGKVLGPLGLPDPVPLNPELSHDGKKVVFQRAGPDRWDLWTMDARGASVRLTSDPARAWCPVWSPGGDRVAFSSDRKGQFDLYEKAAELGAADRLVFASSALKIPMDWSSNGYLLYRETDSKTGVDHLWAKAMEREELPIAVANTQADEREGQFSPDGHWVAYQSDEAAQGQFEIYVQRFPEATGRTRVSINGGAQVRWNANGHEIFYVAPDGRLIAAPFSVSSKDGQAVIGIPSALFQTDIVNGQVPGANKQQYVVAPDGQRFLVTRVAVQPASPVTLILHWTDRSNSTSTHSRTWQLLGALLLVGAALVFVYLRGRPRSGSASAVR